ncbi:MAG: asnB 3 [Myxococcales bacterium]|nr:asnB 3 [Myxococcales bacterium]
MDNVCGIVALFARAADARVSAAAIDRANRALHHRGPDGQRHWVAPHGRVGFGHARLSIIDLETGDQPIANEDGTLHIVANGEFYDYERIQRELVSRGHHLRTRSDSEIALHLYEDRGTACMTELRGEFAFVLWDEANQMLIAARDRFGAKPLYYAEHGGILYLASEAKALFAAGVPARWDGESFFQNNHVSYDQDRSLFDGVYQVPPGHVLIATAGRIQLVRYWDFEYPRSDEMGARLSDNEYAERLRDRLDDAVRVRLRADVPVGFYLSGGIDSCSILGLAARHRSSLHAFTVGFESPDYDETAIAREMAKRVGATFETLTVTGERITDSFADSVFHCEDLVFDNNTVAKFLLSGLVREHGYKVVLSGEGSDELFAGYPHFRRDMALYAGTKTPAERAELVAALEARNPLVRNMLLGDDDAPVPDSVKRTLGFVPSWFGAFSKHAAATRALFTADYIAPYRDRDPYRVMLDRIDPTQLQGRDPLNQSLYLWSKACLPNRMLGRLGDRMEMAHSVEGRLPFLDHPVAELAATLPVDLKIRDMVEKFVLREAVKPFVTDTIYTRQKHTFLAPPYARTEMTRFQLLVQDTLRGPLLKAQPFYDPDRVLALLDRVHATPEAARGANTVLNAILSVCVLQDRFQPAAPRA